MAKQAKRGSYTNEDKRKFVAEIEKGNKSQADVAREVGLSAQAIGGWMKTFGKDAVDPRRAANSNQATANATRRKGGGRGPGRPVGSKNRTDNANQMRAAARSTGPENDAQEAPRQTRASSNIMDNPDVVIAERNYLRAIVKAAGIQPTGM